MTPGLRVRVTYICARGQFFKEFQDKTGAIIDPYVERVLRPSIALGTAVKVFWKLGSRINFWMTG